MRSCAAPPMRCALGVSRRRSPMRRCLWFATALVLLGCMAVQAQIVVSDPAITVRNTTTAILKELLANLQEQQRRQIRRMSRRLSFYTDLQKYKLPEPPRWRIHIFNDRREQEAIDQLDSDVLDPSDEQSTTAVAEKLSGSALIAARQRQARAELLVGIVEQLLV